MAKAVFSSIDAKGTGFIQRSEMEFVMQFLDADLWTAENLDRLFTAVDVNKDELLSWSHLLDWLDMDGADQDAVRHAAARVNARNQLAWKIGGIGALAVAASSSVSAASATLRQSVSHISHEPASGNCKHHEEAVARAKAKAVVTVQDFFYEEMAKGGQDANDVAARALLRLKDCHGAAKL